jgi:hypothetical protein
MPRHNDSRANIVYVQPSGWIVTAEEEMEFSLDRHQRIALRKTASYHRRREMREYLESLNNGREVQNLDQLPEGHEDVQEVNARDEREQYEGERRRH